MLRGQGRGGAIAHGDTGRGMFERGAGSSVHTISAAVVFQPNDVDLAVPGRRRGGALHVN